MPMAYHFPGVAMHEFDLWLRSGLAGWLCRKAAPTAHFVFQRHAELIHFDYFCAIIDQSFQELNNKQSTDSFWVKAQKGSRWSTAACAATVWHRYIVNPALHGAQFIGFAGTLLQLNRAWSWSKVKLHKDMLTCCIHLYIALFCFIDLYCFIIFRSHAVSAGQCLVGWIGRCCEDAWLKLLGPRPMPSAPHSCHSSHDVLSRSQSLCRKLGKGPVVALGAAAFLMLAVLSKFLGSAKTRRI